MKYEHGSLQWQAMVNTIFVERLAAYRQRKPEAAAAFDFSMCEISTDAPAHLAESGQIAWTCKGCKGRLLSFSSTADYGADYVVTAPNTIMRQLGLFDTRGDPLRAKHYDDLCRAFHERGELTAKGKPVPFPREFSGMHDTIASMAA